MRNVLAIFLVMIIGLSLLNNVFAGEVKDMKAVMIIASSNFRDEELLETKEVLESEGTKVTIASSSLSPSQGMLGAVVKPDILLADIKVADYDAIIFVGGIGSQEYWDDSVAHKIAREATSSGKVLGAICIAPVTLANAGVLDGRCATVWSSEGGKLELKGANYTRKNVEIDGNIVTANGPQSAREFGKAILELLRGR